MRWEIKNLERGETDEDIRRDEENVVGIKS